MYHSTGFAGAASRRYAAVHAGSRIESASPHGLIKILFDELMLSMESAAVALERGDHHKATDRHIRAITILHALESSLDFDNGGDIATNLALVYRETRRLMLLAAQEKVGSHARKAHGIIAEIAEAWNRIA